MTTRGQELVLGYQNRRFRPEEEEKCRHTLQVGGTARRCFTGINARIQKVWRFTYAGAVGEAAAAGSWDGCVLACLLDASQPFGTSCVKTQDSRGWDAV